MQKIASSFGTLSIGYPYGTHASRTVITASSATLFETGGMVEGGREKKQIIHPVLFFPVLVDMLFVLERNSLHVEICKSVRRRTLDLYCGIEMPGENRRRVEALELLESHYIDIHKDEQASLLCRSIFNPAGESNQSLQCKAYPLQCNNPAVYCATFSVTGMEWTMIFYTAACEKHLCALQPAGTCTKAASVDD